jgi:hypothetical protein
MLAERQTDRCWAGISAIVAGLRASVGWLVFKCFVPRTTWVMLIGRMLPSRFGILGRPVAVEFTLGFAPSFARAFRVALFRDRQCGQIREWSAYQALLKELLRSASALMNAMTPAQAVR